MWYLSFIPCCIETFGERKEIARYVKIVEILIQRGFPADPPFPPFPILPLELRASKGFF